MLYATGMTDADMNKAQIGISSVYVPNQGVKDGSLTCHIHDALRLHFNSWLEGNPCNMHLLDLADHVKAGVKEGGMVPFRFNTIGVSDGISMGTDGKVKIDKFKLDVGGF